MSLLDPILACPRCHSPLVKEPDGDWGCEPCQLLYGFEEGLPDLYHSPLPEFDGQRPYLWSDLFYLEDLLRSVLEPGMMVAEICSGANYVIPRILERLGVAVTYLSIGDSIAHLKKQQEGVRDYPIRSIIGDATCLPLQTSAIDVLIGHHAINDIWMFKGDAGVAACLDESVRVIRPGGTLIHSHSVNAIDELRFGDISCREVSLDMLAAMLDERWETRQENGGELDWLIARKRK